MKQDNLIIYVSSRNNYDMLEGEVLKNINREGFEFINLDDKSSEAEISKGKKCVYVSQNSFHATHNESGIMGSCWIKERLVSIYLYKDDGLFESAEEIEDMVEVLEKFSDGIY